ncbi:DUF4192 domain-containing protein [Nocardioides currus]|uniref:DUF4192 domain-containing protein n=1 Tax=Nocardioides currus TaxID=2133958 RepID=A0A2R7YTH3_9ACTN|nr:DUF4192 domain-containing protein [Nocardioides currus]PUA79697.1 hypothetical protein C7S10_18475 [Nocardioides currus]
MTTPHHSPRPMRATCPEDLLAFVPVAIGFRPAHSVVLLSLAGDRPFHARADLPDDESDVDLVVEALLHPVAAHAVTTVVLVVYDDDTAVADETAWTLHEALAAAGVEVFEVLRVHDGHWFSVLPGRAPETYRGVPFDVDHHRFAAESVLSGRVTHASREALAATLARDDDAARQVGDLLDAARPLAPAGVRPLVSRHAEAREPAPAEAVATLAVALALPDLRDEAWCWLTRDVARTYVEFWSDVVRRTPEVLVPGPASVLAFTAWLAGEGALAWCAVDLARSVAPQHSLARLVADLLTSATSPDLWASMTRPGEGAA